MHDAGMCRLGGASERRINRSKRLMLLHTHPEGLELCALHSQQTDPKCQAEHASAARMSSWPCMEDHVLNHFGDTNT